MSRPKRLVIRGAPAPGEGLPGYLLRLSLANGYPRTEWLPKAVPLRHPLPAQGGLAAMARMTGLPLGLLRGVNGIPSKEGWVTFGASATPTRLVDLRRPKVCSLCLHERGYLLAEWDLLLWVACPRHGCRLLAECPSCGKPLSWRRSRLDRCCGDAPLTDAPVHEAAPATVDLLRTFAGKIPVVGPSPSLALGELVGHLTLTETFDLVLRLGAAAERHGGRRQLMVGRPPLAAAASLVTAAAEALADWPGGVHSLIDRARDREAASAPVRCSRGSSFLRQQFSGTLRKPCYAFLRDAFDRYVRQPRLAWVRGPARGQKSSLPSALTFVPATEAAREFGVSAATLRTQIERGRIRGEVRATGRGRRFFVVREDLLRRTRPDWVGDRAIAQRSTNRLTVSAAAHELGVGDGTVRAFIAAKLIKRVKTRTGSHIDHASISALLARFDQLLTASDGLAAGSTVTLRRAAAGHGGLGFPEAVRAVLDGRLKPVILDPLAKGLARYRFAAEDVQSLARERLERDGLVSVQDASQILRCNRRVVAQLVRHRLLANAAPGSRTASSRMTISAKSLAAFKRRYTLTSTLAIELGLPRNTVRAALRRQGVAPVNEADMLPKDSAVWRRREAAAALGRFC